MNKTEPNNFIYWWSANSLPAVLLEVICQFLSRYALSTGRTKTLEARGLCLHSFYTTFTKVHFLRQTIYGQRALSGWCIFSNIGLHVKTKRVCQKQHWPKPMNLQAHFIPSRIELYMTGLRGVRILYSNFYKTLNNALQAGGEKRVHNF